MIGETDNLIKTVTIRVLVRWHLYHDHTDAHR